MNGGLTIKDRIIELLEGVRADVFHSYPASFARLPCCCWRERLVRCAGRADGRDVLFEGEWEIDVFANGPEEADSLFKAVDSRFAAARFTLKEAREEYDKALRAHVIKAVYRCVYGPRGGIYQ